MKSRTRIPDYITTPEAKRDYLLERGECLTDSPIFEEFNRLKGKCEVTFVIMVDGQSHAWGVGPHKGK